MSIKIDHVILAVSPTERLTIASRLEEAGLVRGETGKHEGGTANEAVVFAGGGFIELLYWDRADGAPDVWFSETPRIQGIGFSTDDYDVLAEPWAELEDSWNRLFTKTLPDGDVVGGRAAGPIAHLSEFYPFIMDRSNPPHGDLDASACLVNITFAGREHEWWRDQWSHWFPLQEEGDALMTDDGVTFSFQPGPHPRKRLSLTFAVHRGHGVIPISGGTIQFVEPST